MGRKTLIDNPNARKPRGRYWYSWVKSLEESKLFEVFNNYIIPDEDLGVLLKYGILEYDNRPVKAIKTAINGAL